MYFVKKSQRKNPKVSFILLDWTVRESFHVLHYLENQTCERDEYEIIIIEYYNRECEEIKRFVDQVDTWMIMEMPETSYYHKHLMYNLGIVISNGNILSICDSDAIVTPTYVERIIKNFENKPQSIFHMDQFRNSRKDLYPFNYPDIKTVIGEGCINIENDKTSGVCDTTDPLHSKNYGACMCAKREDLISIGGADEHLDFVGHICGPYDMTFRLVNQGLEEIWAEDEFMYHTWHPGSAGEDNYLGPHDGKHMSSTSLMSLVSERVLPLIENEAIKSLRNKEKKSLDALLDIVINESEAKNWDSELLNKGICHQPGINQLNLVETYYGSRIYQDNNGYMLASYSDHGDFIVNVSTETVKKYKTIQEARNEVLSSLTTNTKLKIKAYKLLSKLLNLIRLGIYIFKNPSRLMNVKPRELLKKINRNTNERNVYLANIMDMVIFLCDAEVDHKSNGVPSLILVDKVDSIILKIYGKLGLIPEVESIRIFNSNDIKVITENTSSQSKLYVPANIFVRFYNDFIGFDKKKLVII